MTKTLVLAAAVISTMFLAACATVKGAGEDLQDVSEAVEKKM